MSLINEKTLCLPIAFAIVCNASVIAQPLDTIWTRTYGGISYDYCNDIAMVSDSEFVFTGIVDITGMATGDAWLVKIDGAGEIIWARIYGGGDEDGGSSLCMTPERGFLIAGWTRSFEVVGSDVFLIKTGPEGDTIWTQTYGGQGEDFALDILADTDTSYVVVGFTESFGSGESDIWLLKIDQQGDTIWTKTYGGENDDEGSALSLAHDGGFAIVGKTRSFGLGGSDIFFVRTDADGDSLFTKTFGGSRTDEGNSIISTLDGGYLIAGAVTPEDAGQTDLYVIKTDQNGDSIWAKTYGGSETDKGKSVLQEDGSSYLVAGMTSSYGDGDMDVYLLKVDSGGDTVWTCTYGGVNWDSGYSIVRISANDYLLGGYSFSFGAGYSDAWILRLGNETAIEGRIDEQIPEALALRQNHPNPFNSSSIISYMISDPQHVTLTIYDLLGRKVRTLVNEWKGTGTYSVNLDASTLAGGIYFYRLNAGNCSEVRQFTIIK